MKNNNKRIELNWSKMLGFNQVKAAQAQSDSKTSRMLIGAKVGGKSGVKGGGPV